MKFAKNILYRLNLLEPIRVLLNRYSGLNPLSLQNSRNMKQFYQQFVEPDEMCFDVGANYGNRSRIFLRLGARVVAVEPQQSCVKFLEKEFSKNKNFVLEKVGLSSQEGVAELSVCPDTPEISTLSEKWKSDSRHASGNVWQEKQQIQLTTLDKLIQKHGMPGFCKIDVEGYEIEVLKGLTQPIPVVSFEFTKEFLNDAQECMNLLTAIHDYEFNYSTGENHQLTSKEWLSKDDLFKVLNNNSDSELWGDIYARRKNG